MNGFSDKCIRLELEVPMGKILFVSTLFAASLLVASTDKFNLKNKNETLSFSQSNHFKIILKNNNRIFLREENSNETGPQTTIFIGTIDSELKLDHIDEGIMRSYSFEYFDLKKTQILKNRGLVLFTKPFEVTSWKKIKTVGAIGLVYSDFDGVFEENTYFINCKNEYKFLIKELIPDSSDKNNLKKFRDSISCL